MGISALVQVSAATAQSTPATVRGAHIARGGSRTFALSLNALQTPGSPGGAAGTAAEEAEEAIAGRQLLATTGKKLPDGSLDDGNADGETDKDKASDVAFAWFATTPIVLAPLPPAAAPLGIGLPRPINPLGVPNGSGETAAPELRFPGAALARAGFGEEAPSPQSGAIDTSIPSLLSAPANTAAPAGSNPSLNFASLVVAAAAPPADGAEPARSSAKTTRIELPTAPAIAAAARPAEFLAAPAHPTAAQPLAASLVALQAELPTQSRRAVRENADPIVATMTGTESRPSFQVAPTADAQQPALDMRRHEWMASMVDRIEAMRDAGGARETQIRLTPGSLGAVDVSIRHEGDRVHVHFTAETPAAQALLNDAQPRLAEMAEARGLRLGQSTVGLGVDAGTAGQGGPRQEAPTATQAQAPASATTAEADPTDDRIA